MSGSATTSGAVWVYDPDNATLGLMLGDHCFYEIDLERCTTSAAVLDWIMQIARKSPEYIDDATLGALVRELDLRLDPQRTLCGCGKELGPIKPLEVLRQVAADNERDKAPWIVDITDTRRRRA